MALEWQQPQHCRKEGTGRELGGKKQEVVFKNGTPLPSLHRTLVGGAHLFLTALVKSLQTGK